MKKSIRTGFATLAAIAFCSLASCKDKETTETTEATETVDTATTEPDTSAVSPTLNDTNASGTTSGEMEQVP